MKPSLDMSALPSSNVALRFVCHCFDIGEKELSYTLERVRKFTPTADGDFPKKISRTLIARAETQNGPWLDVLQTLRREALYDRIRRDNGKPLFSFTGAVTEKLVFSFPRLYEKLLPDLTLEGISPTNAMWVLVENVFVPTVFIEFIQNWQCGLGTEFRGDACWYLPVLSEGEKLKPVQRVLDSWLRVAGYRTAYGISEEMGTPDLRRNVDRWRTGEVVPTLAALHSLVKQFAKNVRWLDEPDDWKARFTLACAMQKLCNKMDVFFKDVRPDSSFALADMLRRIETERIVSDDHGLLAGRQTFFGTRLLQLRLQHEKKWKTQVLAKIKRQRQHTFPPEVSDSEIAQCRGEMERQMNPGNHLLEYIKRHHTHKSGMTLEDHVYNIGVAELNRLLTLTKAGGRGARQL
jgi:hypothetical protein